MKLRNKETGDIVVLSGITCKGDTTYVRFDDEKGNFMFAVCSLAELNEEWEDYEEPKEYWYVDFDGSLMQTSDIKCDKYVFDKLKEIGNHFEAEEEARKAVEKLKAWKRLKDESEFEIISYEFDAEHSEGHIDFYIPRRNTFDTLDLHRVRQKLDLLFGGEE